MPYIKETLEVKKQLNQIKKYYFEIDKRLSKELSKQYVIAKERIKKHPESGYGYGKYRMMRLNFSEYAIMYYQENDAIYLLAIHHDKQR